MILYINSLNLALPSTSPIVCTLFCIVQQCCRTLLLKYNWQNFVSDAMYYFHKFSMIYINYMYFNDNKSKIVGFNLFDYRLDYISSTSSKMNILYDTSYEIVPGNV